MMGLTVGLTYDLRDDYRLLGYSEEETAEFDSVQTVEALEGALAAAGCRPDRIGSIHELTRRLADVASGRLSPDLVVTGARVLSTYSERIHGDLAVIRGQGARQHMHQPRLDVAAGRRANSGAHDHPRR